MLADENRREALRHPRGDDVVEHLAAVRRINEHEVVRAFVERGGERHGVLLEHPRAFLQPQSSDVRLERVQARGPRLKKVTALGTA